MSRCHEKGKLGLLRQFALTHFGTRAIMTRRRVCSLRTAAAVVLSLSLSARGLSASYFRWNVLWFLLRPPSRECTLLWMAGFWNWFWRRIGRRPKLSTNCTFMHPESEKRFNDHPAIAALQVLAVIMSILTRNLINCRGGFGVRL